MTCIVDQAPLRPVPVQKESFLHKLSRVFRAKDKGQPPQLDPRALSDHMKRDLGFLDGRF